MASIKRPVKISVISFDVRTSVVTGSTTMKVLLLALYVGSACASGYHEAIGIPAATRIKQQETAHILSSRVINGKLADSGSYPYYGGLIILLASNMVSVCGSTVISSTKLITAAHCWNDGYNQAVQFQVVLGSTTLFSGGVRTNTNRVTVHEGYIPSIVINDIAIATVPVIEFNDDIKPIKLPADPNSFLNVLAQVVGFGKIGDMVDIKESQQLRYAEVKIRSGSYCEMYGTIFRRSLMICAESTQGGPCGGDSGGPLVHRDNESEDVLIGVVSYGSESGCTAGHPTVYTRITSYIDWIKMSIK